MLELKSYIMESINTNSLAKNLEKILPDIVDSTDREDVFPVRMGILNDIINYEWLAEQEKDDFCLDYNKVLELLKLPDTDSNKDSLSKAASIVVEKEMDKHFKECVKSNYSLDESDYVNPETYTTTNEEETLVNMAYRFVISLKKPKGYKSPYDEETEVEDENSEWIDSAWYRFTEVFDDFKDERGWSYDTFYGDRFSLESAEATRIDENELLISVDLVQEADGTEEDCINLLYNFLEDNEIDFDDIKIKNVYNLYYEDHKKVRDITKIVKNNL